MRYLVGVFCLFTSVLLGADPSPAALTAQEKADGWTMLFDGKSTAGWTGMRGRPFPSQSWTVEDGLLRTQPDGSGGDARTVEEYEDFELSLEWKISPKGNAGIKYMVQEDWADPGFRPSFSPELKERRRRSAVGPEYQLLDDSRISGKEGWELSSAGALYLLYPPQNKKVNEPGGWNTTRIVVKGNHAEHWLNGVKVVEYELGSKDLLERVAKTKFSHVPGYGLKGSGPIVLQHHGSPVWFRNIKIRRL